MPANDTALAGVPTDRTLPFERGPAVALARLRWREAGYPDAREFVRALGGVGNDRAALDRRVAELGDRPAPDTLSLQGLRLRELPPELYDSQGLRFLFLGGNRLETLPEALIAAFTSLAMLDLHDNPLRELPASLFGLTQLSELQLGRTALTRLPIPQAPLTALRTLGLDGTRWLDLPDGFFARTPNLDTLRLDDSQRERLPDDIATLTALRRLDLQNNPLGTLPGWIGELERLDVLNLEQCGLTALPRSLSQLTHMAGKVSAKTTRLLGLRLAKNAFKDKALRQIARLENPERTLQAMQWARDNGD